MPSEWQDPKAAEAFSQRITPHRAEGEAALVECLPAGTRLRVLDLGCGDGRMLRVLAAAGALGEAIGIDDSAPMLRLAAAHPQNSATWRFAWHDLREPLATIGGFDAVVSGLALHHLDDNRKRALAREVAAQLRPGGRFLNLDIVQCRTADSYRAFLSAIGRDDGGDPLDRPATIDDQLNWLDDAGFSEVDCIWRWRGLALCSGTR